MHYNDQHHLINTLHLLPINIDSFRNCCKIILYELHGKQQQFRSIHSNQNPPLLWKWYSTTKSLLTFICFIMTYSRGEETHALSSDALLSTKYIITCIFPIVFGRFLLLNKWQHPPQSRAALPNTRVKTIACKTSSNPSRGEETASKSWLYFIARLLAWNVVGNVASSVMFIGNNSIRHWWCTGIILVYIITWIITDHHESSWDHLDYHGPSGVIIRSSWIIGDRHGS